MSRRRKSNCSREGNSPGQYTGFIQTYFTSLFLKMSRSEAAFGYVRGQLCRGVLAKRKSENPSAVLCACNTTRIDPSCQPLRVSLTPSRD